MATEPARPSILCIGLQYPTEAIATIIEKDIENATDRGFDVDKHFIPIKAPHDGVLDLDERLERRVQEVERGEARMWDGATVGWGLRGFPEYTETFEEVVDVLRRRVPGLRLGFNSAASKLCEAVVRNFGEKRGCAN